MRFFVEKMTLAQMFLKVKVKVPRYKPKRLRGVPVG